MRSKSFYRNGQAQLRADLLVVAEVESARRAAVKGDLEAKRADHQAVTRADLVGAKVARVGGLWFRIVRVNRSTVSLVTDYNPSTGFELVTRFPFSQVREVR